MPLPVSQFLWTMPANSSPQRSDPLVGQTLPDGLRVIERLGGADDEPLYRAQYAQTGPPVALQFLRLPWSSQDSSAVFPSLTRFWQQLRRSCQIRHPNVAGLLELGKTADGRVYAVSELLTGLLLSEVLATRGKLPLAEAVEICLQAAAGLQAAHQDGVAHGRVSPRTILITTGEDDRLLVKLVGFDFSWYQADSGQGLDQAADKPYSSPERLAGSAPDAVSDVFSLGAVLHLLLTGRPPSGGPAPGSIPRVVRRVLDRALASPEQRYPTVAAFAEALRQAAAVPGNLNRAGRWRWGWLAAGIAVLLVVASVARAWDRIGPNLGGIPNFLKAQAGSLKSVTASYQRSPSADPARASKGRESADESGAVARSKVADSTVRPSPTTEARDTGGGPYISPFRRSHPWAAHPTGRTYFPSSCPLALASSELVYFTSEKEARATGRSRSTAPGCS